MRRAPASVKQRPDFNILKAQPQAILLLFVGSDELGRS